MNVVLRLAGNVVQVFAIVQSVVFTDRAACLRFVDEPFVSISDVRSARVFDDRGNELSSWTATPQGDS